MHAEGEDAVRADDEEVARANDADHVSDTHLAGGGEDGGGGTDADGAVVSLYKGRTRSARTG